MPNKAKKKAGALKKYYLSSQILDSSRSVNLLKDFGERERATYRREVPADAVDQDDLDGAQEVTRTISKMPSFSEDGEMSIVEVEMVSYDKSSWRYYFIPETLEDLERFVSKLGLEVGLNTYDPDNCEEDEEKWAEMQIGMPLPEEKAVILQIMDGFLLEELLGDIDCGDPGCESCDPPKKKEKDGESD